MALLMFEGFDHYGNGVIVGTGNLTGKWATGSANYTTNNATFRTGTHSLQFGGSGVLTSQPLPASGGFVVGFALYLSSFGSAPDIIRIREVSTVHLALAVTTGGLLTVKRGATIIATGTTVLALNSWNYLEFKGIIHDTTGSYGVRINGVAEAALTTAGPVDTNNAGATGQWDRVAFILDNFSNHYLDDVYICDQSGSAPRNDYLGVVKVEMLMPQTDAVAAGSNAGLTPSTGTDHGALVDELGPNTTDYNSSPTVGLKDTYNYPSPVLTGTILGVQTNLYVAKSDAIARQVCAVVRAGGVDYDGANVSPATTFGYLSTIWAQNPNTAVDWTSGDVATLQAGMKVTL